MFDNFRNYSSSAHQVRCEDSPSKGMYDHCQSDNLDLHSRSQVRLNLDYFFYLQYLAISLYIQTWHYVRRIQGKYICAHAGFDDLDLDTMLQWVGKGKKEA